MAFHDVNGEPVQATSLEAVRLLDDAVTAYARARRTTRDRLAAALAVDPDCVLAHCLDGYLHLLSSKRASVPSSREALGRAESAASRDSTGRREQLHCAALKAWSKGDMRGAADVWNTLLDEFPRDLIALKVSQFVLSYLGESEGMRDRVTRVLPSWTADHPGYGFTLGCYAYALEEAGDYRQAEDVGRRAVELDRGDIWAAHAVAHVAEMEGRLEDGIRWISSLADEWHDCSNFALHLKWHESLYHLELEQHDQVLALYDRDVRAESTDEYLDIANAVSLLWRLEQAGVDVGARWHELAARAEGHIDDHTLVFVDLHYVMALAAAGNDSAVRQMLKSSEEFSSMSRRRTEAQVMAEVGLPLARAIVAHRAGSYGAAVDQLYPVRHLIKRIGASHAQRDLFHQLLIDAAWRGGRHAEARELLAERLVWRPGNRWGLKLQRALTQTNGTTN